MTFDQALVEKARETRSAGELLTLAKENGIELTSEEAEKHFTELHPIVGELSDEELENVAGGGCGKKKVDEFYYNVGDTVTFDTGDGTIKEGEILWKNYVNDFEGNGGSVIYRICVGANSYSGEHFYVKLNQIKSRVRRGGEE